MDIFRSTSRAAVIGASAVVPLKNGTFEGWVLTSNARREAVREGAFGFWKRVTPLPDGLRRISGGRGALEFQCECCGEWTEWPAEADDFEPGANSNVCGGSPRCCP